jgi:protein tyrosine kinase modulator
MLPSQGYLNVSRRPPDVEDYIDIVRRYRSWIIGPLFAGLVISVVVAFLWPDTYVSSAVMRITPQQVPERLVPSNLNVQMGERLNAMQQDILSRGSLTELIQRPALDLYKSDRARKPMEDVIDQMRKSIKLTILDTPNTQGRRVASAFQISFSYTDRYKAQAVVRELVGKFTEQNQSVLRQQSQATTTFLNDELSLAKTYLDRLDHDITQFRIENQGRLPEQIDSNLATMTALHAQLASVTEALNRNSQEKMMLETQLQNFRNQLNFYAGSLEETTTQQGQVVRNDRLLQMNKIILDTETALSALRETYKDDHPDIRALVAKLNVLKKERDALEKDEQQQQQSVVPERPRKIVNAQVAKTLEDIKMNIASVETSMRAKEMDIRDRTRQQAELHKQVEALQSRIEVSPINQQKYGILMRDYALAKQKYEDLNLKKSLSETATNMEERKAGENLEVLDPASLPEVPTEPNRLLIAAIGMGVGFVMGIMLAGGKEMKDTSLKNLKDVRAYTNLAVLSSIPLLENALLVRRKRRLFWLAWTSAVIFGTIAMGGSMYYYYFGRS